MHNNYHFLKYLVPALGEKLIGTTLTACFSQNKNELILAFGQDPTFLIKAYLNPSFCCLSFPEEFRRARKNSVDLFTPAINETVCEVKIYLNERCFSIHFQNEACLIFKMHGNRSNIILFSNNEVIEVFKNSLENDFKIQPGQLNRTIDQSKAAFLSSDRNLKALFPTFGPIPIAHLEGMGFNTLDIDEQWEAVKKLLQLLDNKKIFMVKWNEQRHLSLLKTGDVLEEFQSPLAALNTFFLSRITTDAFNTEKRSVLTRLTQDIKKVKGYIKNTSVKLDQINHETNYSQLGDILMAHLHNIKPSIKTVTLPNFYKDNTPVTIKLKRDLSAQKNAEIYYRKSKNQSREISILTQNITQKKLFLSKLLGRKQAIENTESLKELRALTPKRETKLKQEKTKPYRVHHFGGYEIRIGKNARNNDEMIKGHAHKEDLWLHAKDVSGSHVLIKNQQGKIIPDFVIEHAAELAAYYSKRKNDTLCPVIYTPRKYIRKRKGDPPGAVVVDREKVMLVPPRPDHS
ncbi:DUF814 domain-containing protein [Fulvivirga sp. M361]|uniref:NFACT RNA binding domain-containing protein n=1 Tax=Fulvivirga sp. M361 TaxID=2594266 RepID=UPI00117A117F|nr:NFACT RNA binding domain-containing protein [Fulvivirga sp. M361]TRX62187.1 DUF814 domain-containing protein [Fulvivirga sp. M361]